MNSFQVNLPSPQQLTRQKMYQTQQSKFVKLPLNPVIPRQKPKKSSYQPSYFFDESTNEESKTHKFKQIDRFQYQSPVFSNIFIREQLKKKPDQVDQKQKETSQHSLNKSDICEEQQTENPPTKQVLITYQNTQQTQTSFCSVENGINLKNTDWLPLISNQKTPQNQKQIKVQSFEKILSQTKIENLFNNKKKYQGIQKKQNSTPDLRPAIMSFYNHKKIDLTQKNEANPETNYYLDKTKKNVSAFQLFVNKINILKIQGMNKVRLRKCVYEYYENLFTKNRKKHEQQHFINPKELQQYLSLKK